MDKLSAADVQLLILGDPRRQSEHHGVLAKFESSPSCCKRRGIARCLQDRASFEVILGLGHMFRCMAWALLLSIACVEAVHARHRRISHKQMQWSTFSAIGVITSFREIFSLHKALQDKTAAAAAPEAEQLEEPSPPAPPPPDELDRVGRRAKTAIEIFRDEWVQTQRALGRRFNPVSKLIWKEVKEAFEALSADRKEHYSELHEATLNY